MGTVITWPFPSAIPDGYLECNGQAVNASLYPKLAALCSAVPNYQGIFLRGYGSQSLKQNNGTLVGQTSTTYTSSSIGILQGDAIRNITGNQFDLFTPCDEFNSRTESWYRQGALASTYGTHHLTSDISGGGNYDWGVDIIFDASLAVPTSNENRPINTAVKYIIKAK